MVRPTSPRMIKISRKSSGFRCQGLGPITRICVLVMITAAFPLSVGCGPSQQELMMRQAQRARGDDGSPPVKQISNVEPELNPTPVAEPPKQVPLAIVDEIANEIVTAGGIEIEVKELVPISDRKPAQPLSDGQRRLKAYENLKSVSGALLTYLRDKGRLPPTFKEANGFQTLSWRVEILPYLGYEKLYKKFDPSVPWNRPPNDTLLEFIPDEFVSPERFDTKTNIVMPSRRGFIGGEGGQLRSEDIADGTANTLMIVEVNEDFATPWSAPVDSAPGSHDAARAGVLGLRKDGAFAVWSNGWPVLLANELPEKVFWDAMTVEAGDGLQGGKVHRDIPVKNVTDAAVAAADETAAPVIAQARPQTPNLPVQPVVAFKREDVPTTSELADSQAKLRKLYADQIRNAKADLDKVQLAKEMLQQASGMREDPADAYALQTAAMRLAIEGGSIQQLLEAIDQRVGRFEVDAYEENIHWLLAFGKGVAQRGVQTVQGMEFVKRAIKVNYAAIHDDDFVRAMALTRYAYRLANLRRDEDIPKNLNRLKSLLGASQREYDDASESLAEFRIDPDNGDAAAAVGRYLCFIKGDWTRGLPLLTRGGFEPLQEMAALDLKGADDYMNKVAIGDAWWDLAEKARTDVYRQSARDRAVHWYSQAFAVMPDSLDRLHVKTRLDDAGDAPPSSPLALVAQLAKDAQVDLTVGLAAVANVGQKGVSRPYAAQYLGGDDDDRDG